MSDLHYFQPSWITRTDQQLDVDVCVYGASSAGVAAAVELRQRGKSVALLQPGKFVGGLTTGGLGETDYGKKHVIGGLSRQFYAECGRPYGKDEEWKFEPHVASGVYDKWLADHQVEVHLCQYVDRVEKDGNRITTVTMLGGLRVKARLFIDCSYEGDLMSRSGVTYTVGREGNDTYGETLNGIQVRDKHQFSHPVDPFVTEGDPASGLLPWIVGEDLSRKQGQGDQRVQAYCFRMCMTDDPSLRIDWQKPQRYDPMQYVLAGRWFRGEKDEYNDQLSWSGRRLDVPRKFDIFPNKTAGGFHKTDTNNHGPVSSDFIGANHDWADACYERREALFQAHITYQQGYYWYMANSDDVPERYRKAYQRWGLPKDEFQQTNHWPHQLYVREARRMVGAYVLTELDIVGKRREADPIGMGSYGMDSHNCSRFVMPDPATGRPRVMNDGDVQAHGFDPYGIPYRCITPRQGECANLLVPVCLSSSHIAYGSARMEPVFMVLGQSAAMAAAIAIDEGQAVQAINYAALRQQMEDAGQILAVAK